MVKAKPEGAQATRNKFVVSITLPNASASVHVGGIIHASRHQDILGGYRMLFSHWVKGLGPLGVSFAQLLPVCVGCGVGPHVCRYNCTCTRTQLTVNLDEYVTTDIGCLHMVSGVVNATPREINIQLSRFNYIKARIFF